MNKRRATHEWATRREAWPRSSVIPRLGGLHGTPKGVSAFASSAEPRRVPGQMSPMSATLGDPRLSWTNLTSILAVAQ